MKELFQMYKGEVNLLTIPFFATLIAGIIGWLCSAENPEIIGGYAGALMLILINLLGAIAQMKLGSSDYWGLFGIIAAMIILTAIF